MKKDKHTPTPEIMVLPTGHTFVCFTVANQAQAAELKARLIRVLNCHEELKAMLEDCREFILRFDESDDKEIKISKRISDLLAKAEGVINVPTQGSK